MSRTQIRSQLPNVTLDKTPLVYSRSEGSYVLQTSWRVADRKTPAGAEHDLLIATPQFLDPGVALAYEQADGCDFTARINPKCLPRLWRGPMTIEEVPAKCKPFWRVSVTYSTTCQTSIGDRPFESYNEERWQFSIDTTTRNQKIATFPLSAIRCLSVGDLCSIAGSPELPAKKQARLRPEQLVPSREFYNVSHDGDVRGVDVLQGVLRVRLTKCYAPGTLTRCRVIEVLPQLVGAVNLTPFGPRDIQSIDGGRITYGPNCWASREVMIEGFEVSATAPSNQAERVADLCPANYEICRTQGVIVRLQDYGEDTLACNLLVKPSEFIDCGLTPYSWSYAVDEETNTQPQHSIRDPFNQPSGPIESVANEPAYDVNGNRIVAPPPLNTPMYRQKIWVAGHDIVNITTRPSIEKPQVDVGTPTNPCVVVEHHAGVLPDVISVHPPHRNADFNDIFNFAQTEEERENVDDQCIDLLAPGYEVPIPTPVFGAQWERCDA